MNTITTDLLAWYDKNHRILPWRISPHDLKTGKKPDPYHVWLSEIMLQQTTVEAVKPYFIKFLKQWPTVSALSKASEDDVLKAWAGLGYYSRARNLKACADTIMEQFSGQFPKSLKKLKSLPGIGDYTSAAISAIAFDLPAAVVDGNVERVVSRLYQIETPLPLAKSEIKEKTKTLTPKKRAGDFAQAMMDLGATLCSPKRPSCFLCPIRENCMALLHDDPERFPFKLPKKERPFRYGEAFVIFHNNQIYLQKRPPKGLLASMSEVPSFFEEGTKAETLSLAPFKAKWQQMGQATHIFTHFTLEIDVYFCVYDKDVLDGKSAHSFIENGWWADVKTLGDEALPTVMKKIITVALPDSFKKQLKK